MSVNKVIYDGSPNCRHGEVHGGLIRTGGTTRDYRQVLHLNNDVRGDIESEVSQHVKVRKGSSHIETDNATISFWIRPTGVSKENSGIVYSDGGTDGTSHGIVLTANGNAYSLGYKWKNQATSHIVDLETFLDHDKWSFVVVLIYASGIVRVFLDNIYVKYYDLGVKHEVVAFDNLAIGKFSGMIDDVRFYSDTLYYGKVSQLEPAKSYVKALYETSRVPNEPLSEIASSSMESNALDFYYLQSVEFLDAHTAYVKHEGNYNSLDEQRKQQFVLNFGGLQGGTSGKLAYASNDFTPIAGKRTGRFVEY